ncbi:hypothetical protein FACS1894176_03730 [Bacteroidia bacterium]|nr:hypothetical protein FACS1894176_03730 [Bacteroidia bacterium]
MTDEGDVGTYPLVLNTTINVAYTLALVVPLLALVVVLLGRIIVLWVFIAIAPILILLKVFEKQVKIDFIKKDNMFSLESIGSLLLAPVLISFAVSLSTMFIILIKKITTTNITSNDTTSIMGLFELNIKGGGVDFSKLLISIMGIGIVRFLLFWAIEQTKIGKSV